MIITRHVYIILNYGTDNEEKICISETQIKSFQSRKYNDVVGQCC